MNASILLFKCALYICSERYRENGNPDTAGMVIEKAAKSVLHSVTTKSYYIYCRTMEHSAPDKAAVLYLEVASLHEVSR